MLAFAPDLDDTTPDILTDVSAVPTARGYRSPPMGVSTGSDTLPDPSQGGALLLGLTGATRTIVGTVDALYELAAGTWNDVSDTGGYSAGSARWSFAQFGDTALAINKVTQLQASTGGDFAAVSNAPMAGCMTACKGHLVLGDCDDTGTGLPTPFGDQPHRWWASQLFNPTGSWDTTAGTASQQASCTSGLLVDTPGGIKVMASLGEQVVAYKEKSIYVGDFVGQPDVIRWRVVSVEVGANSPRTIIAANFAHYFVGDDDFYAFDGSRPQKIGPPLREWFFDRLNRTYIASIQGLHDRANNLIMWFYPTGSDGTLNSAVAYHYPTNRWGAFELTLTDVLEAVTDALTYGDLGPAIAVNYGDLTPPYNSPLFSAGTPILAYFDENGDLQSLSGSGVTMSLTTGWMGSEDTMTVCTGVRPRFRAGAKAPTGSLVHSHTDALGDAPTIETASAMHDARFDALASGRYHRFAMEFTDGFCEVESIGPRFVDGGEE